MTSDPLVSAWMVGKIVILWSSQVAYSVLMAASEIMYGCTSLNSFSEQMTAIFQLVGILAFTHTTDLTK